MNIDQQANFLRLPVPKFDDIVTVKDTGIETQPEIHYASFHNPDLIPEALRPAADDAGSLPADFFQGPKALDYKTLKALYIPDVLFRGYAVRDEVKERLEALNRVYLKSISSENRTPRCHRCQNTGVSKWAARGSVAKVCRCVRLGAIQEGATA